MQQILAWSSVILLIAGQIAVLSIVAPIAVTAPFGERRNVSLPTPLLRRSQPLPLRYQAQ